MTNLNVDIPKNSHTRIVITVGQAVRKMDIGSTTTAEDNQTTQTATDDNPFYFKDQLDFQIAMIESLAG